MRPDDRAVAIACLAAGRVIVERASTDDLAAAVTRAHERLIEALSRIDPIEAPELVFVAAKLLVDLYEQADAVASGPGDIGRPALRLVRGGCR